MINTLELEKRWIKYKTRIFGSLFFILFFVISIPYLSFYLFEQYDLIVNQDKNISKVIIKDTLITQVETNVPKEIVVDKNIIDKDINDVVLAPSIPMIDFNNEKRVDRENAQKKAEKKRLEKRTREAKERAYHQKIAKRRAALKRKRALARKEAKNRKLIKAKTSAMLSKDELNVVSGNDIDKRHKKESKKIDFQSTSNNYMAIMKRKFEQNRNPREAILIAKAYYKAGNYVESERWALKANNLDKKNEESWFLFAQSKAKLGKRREALRILVSYDKTHKSPKVKELIAKIKEGSL